MDNKKEAPDFLRIAEEIWKQRQTHYGSSYQKGGAIYKAFFPDGITLETEEDFARFATFVMIVSKLNRYSQSITNGGHMDSANDLINFSAILSEFTEQ
jgi:hypothetical protein